MNIYTVNLIHTENGFPEVRKRTLKVNENENVIDIAESLYVNPIEIVSVIDEFTNDISYVASSINVNSLKKRAI